MSLPSEPHNSPPEPEPEPEQPNSTTLPPKEPTLTTTTPLPPPHSKIFVPHAGPFTEDSIVWVSVAVMPPRSDKKKSRSALYREKIMARLGGARPQYRIVHMPYREYLACFARDEKGTYVGTEEQREWTVEELDRKYGENRPKPSSVGILRGIEYCVGGDA